MATCGCGRELGRRNASGRCRSCTAKHNNACPEVSARRVAAIRARFADPAIMQAHRNRIAHYMATMPDAERERRRENGRKLYREVLSRPDIVAKREAARLAPEARKRRGLTLSDKMLPWCPREYRPLYCELRAMGESVADARAVVEGEMARVEAVAAAERQRPLTHAEQLERVRTGQATVSAKAPLPSRQLTHTPGGVASGML